VNTLSEKYPKLKPFNRKAGKQRNIRVGATVNTSRGVGIVTWRKGDGIEVAVRPDREGEVSSCYRYRYSAVDVDLADEPVNESDRLYGGAWYWIINQAIGDNQDYESIKHRGIVDEWVSNIPGKRVDREVSMGAWGSTTYTRYTGVNKHGQPFDFELNVKGSAFTFPHGDRIVYAIGANDGYISDMNGHGWIYRRKITDSDINYGLARYAGPQEAD
jgi:hypothetical protein